jgi:hypothetical protein
MFKADGFGKIVAPCPIGNRLYASASRVNKTGA